MLVKCPKCHFEQPKDAYCAKCGIAMDDFKPTKTPLWILLLKSTLIQILILGGVIFWGYKEFIIKSKQSSFKEIANLNGFSNTDNENMNASNSSAEMLQNNTSDQNSTALNNTNQTPSGETTTSSIQNSSSPPNTSPNSEIKNSNSSTHSPTNSSDLNKDAFESDEIVDQPSNTQTNSTNNSNQATSAPKVVPVKISIKYLEIQKSIISNLKTLTNATEHSIGEYSIFKISNQEKSYKPESWKILDQASRQLKDIKLNKNNNWFTGVRDSSSGTVAGLNTTFSFVQSEAIKSEAGEELSLNLEIQKDFPDVLEVSESSNSPLTYNFFASKGDILIIEGLLPRKKIPAENKELQWMNNSVSQIFFSDSFSNNVTEFIISVEFN